MSFHINFVFALGFCGCFLFGDTAKTSLQTKEKSGPFITVLKSVTKCDKPTVPYTNESIAYLHNEMKKNNILKGNFTVFGKNKNIYATIREFYYTDGEWQTTFNVKICCRNRMMYILVKLLGLKYNKKTCEVPKGSWVFEADYNKIEHTFWGSAREYGRMMRRIEVHAGRGTVSCVQIEADVKPASS